MPGAVMRLSTASVATRSSGPAFLCSLFCRAECLSVSSMLLTVRDLFLGSMWVFCHCPILSVVVLVNHASCQGWLLLVLVLVSDD